MEVCERTLETSATNRQRVVDEEAANSSRSERATSVQACGLPITPFTFDESLREVDRLVSLGRPAFFITANLNYAMLSARDARLRAVNREAAFLLADGMPLVWSARLRGLRVPERVAGADLVPAMCGLAAERGYRVFLLGARPGVAEQAAERLTAIHPRLRIAGVEWPQIDRLDAHETEELKARIRQSQCHLLIAALGQPKGELWLAEHYRTLGRAVCVQVGASLDFAARATSRAPQWMQRTGLEWAYRIAQEPRRLAWRYTQNAAFLAGAMIRGERAI
jgi:N-acetylglucosaminyldiphosphoundecaprenol N-acetyl-beta-D-mannosaminyltransferase